MAKRKTAAAQRREALVQKKLEKRDVRNAPHWEDVLDELLQSIGIDGGYIRMLSCDSTNNILKKFSQSMIAKDVAMTTNVLKAPSLQDNAEEFFNRLFMPKSLPCVLTADEQTAGRGRQSNTWWTGRGSLALSMLLDTHQYGLTPQTSAHLSLAIGYATMQALREITEETLVKSKKTNISTPNIEIRWPNDVYVNDRKITGILIESPNMHHIIVGIGVNTNNTAADAPEEIRDRIITLNDVLEQKIEQNRFVFLLCRCIMNVLEFFPSQLPSLIENVEQHLYQVGKTVRISRENELIVGECLGLNADGSLRVLTENGEKAVISGVII